MCEGVEQELAGREQRLQDCEAEIDTTAESLQQQRSDLDRWAGELADERLALEAERREAKPANSRIEIDQLQAMLSAARERADKLLSERDDARRQLEQSQQGKSDSDEQLKADNTRLRDRLYEAEAALAELPTNNEQPELRGKFDLAMADVERLRTRVEELETELAERPTTSAHEAAELSALRSEREELVEQLKQLRSASLDSTTAENEQLEDLRHRFELAVEDVRQLKIENAELEQQLSNAALAAGSGDSNGLDWEAQKRRLLAMLEEEGESTEPERQQERATIEGTIRITDEMIAEKDRQIAELQQGGEGSTAEASAEDLLSDDERLDADRERLAALQQQWQDKLRDAELELSVERAKIAREQAELDEYRSELESERGKPIEDTKGQRRWLDKLGLGGGE